MEYTACALCLSPKQRILFKTLDLRYGLGQQKFHLVQCAYCGLIYLNPRPTPQEIAQYYPDHYYGASSSFWENLFTRCSLYFFHRQIKRFKKNGKILDVGCGAGKFLAIMQKKGYKAYGLDISATACKLARSQGLKVFEGTLETVRFPRAYFDIITLWHILEHLHRPSANLKEIERILKKDGILLIETPNIQSLSFRLFKKYCFHLELPRHLYQWSFATLQATLQKHGFLIYQHDLFSLRFPLNFLRSFQSVLKSYRIKTPFAQTTLLLALPFLGALTLLAKLIPGKGETIRIYARKKRNQSQP